VAPKVQQKLHNLANQETSVVSSGCTWASSVQQSVSAVRAAGDRPCSARGRR